jgi:hypothetical protein
MLDSSQRGGGGGGGWEDEEEDLFTFNDTIEGLRSWIKEKKPH